MDLLTRLNIVINLPVGIFSPPSSLFIPLLQNNSLNTTTKLQRSFEILNVEQMKHYNLTEPISLFSQFRTFVR